jgi:pyruvate carboxylase
MSEPKQFSQISLENGVFETRLTRKFSGRRPFQKRDPRLVQAAIPGAVSEITVTAGTAVREGDTVLVLEAMKMLNRVKACRSGTVKTIRVKTGEKVAKGQLLMVIE